MSYEISFDDGSNWEALFLEGKGYLCPKCECVCCNFCNPKRLDTEARGGAAALTHHAQVLQKFDSTNEKWKGLFLVETKSVDEQQKFDAAQKWLETVAKLIKKKNPKAGWKFKKAKKAKEGTAET